MADAGERGAAEDGGVVDLITARSAVTVLILSLGGCQRHDPGTILAEKCAFVARYISYLRGGNTNLVFSTFQEQVGNRNGDAPEDVRAVGPSGAPRDLMLQLTRQHGVSALAVCLTLAAGLRSKGVRVGPQAVARSLEAGGRSAYSPPVVGVSLPALSDDGNEALLESSYVFGIEGAGSGGLIYFRRDSSGKWSVVSTSQLWVS